MFALTPAATFAASVRPTEDVSARIGVALAVNGPATLQPGDAFSYQITVTNDGPGSANSMRVDLPLDANVVVDDFNSPDSSAFVQTLTSDMISVQFHDLDPRTAATATILAHISADAPAALTISSRATANWNDVNFNRTSESDGVKLVVGSGAPAPATKSLDISSTDAVDAGTILTVSGSFYDPVEAVGIWLNTPAGITLPAESLGQTDSTLSGTVAGLDTMGLTDSAGMLTYNLDTTGLPSGTYSLVAQGLTSGMQSVVSFTIK
jgi:hypothetical protein